MPPLCLKALTPEVHLIGAVEHYDQFPERPAHVLRSLSLAGPGGPGRGAAHAHTDGLRQRDVASVC